MNSRSSLPRKRKRGCFHQGRLARAGISRDSVPSPSVCSPVSLLCHGFELMVLLECSGDGFPVCSFFYLREHRDGTAFANASTTGIL